VIMLRRPSLWFFPEVAFVFLAPCCTGQPQNRFRYPPLRFGQQLLAIRHGPR
jgi:hypothetical protein